MAYKTPDYGFPIPDTPRRVISILGSTGSIGRQTLEVAKNLGIRVCALSANTNIRLLENQIREYKPSIAAVIDDDDARDLKERVRDLDVDIVPGPEGLIEAACADGAGIVVTAVAGTSGLLPTLAAIRLGRRIALANKETLVCAGELVMKSASEHGARIIPVDSEHSAVFQCLRNEKPESIKKLILTASGGPFRGMKREELAHVTPEMALRHPNWVMGKKVTVDSATMMNKGLEIIEAAHLFQVDPERINVVIHPESIIHSMVEFDDNSIKAQLSTPDMRLPIQYALTYPNRMESLASELDLTLLKSLTFLDPDREAFPCLDLAIKTASIRGTACAIMNAANEAAVELFLRGDLSFYGIFEAVSAALDNIAHIENPILEDILSADERAKLFVYERSRDN